MSSSAACGGQRSRRPRPGEAAGWLFSGVVAAGLGFAALTVVVLLLWATSPYPEGGPEGALHIAAGLWLLAHGVELLRTEAGGGAAPAPLGLPPILLTALPLWLLYRAARTSFAGTSGGVPSAVGWLSAGYLLAASATAVFASLGPLGVAPLSAAVRLPLFAVGVTALGARSADRSAQVPGVLWFRLLGAVRAAAAGAGALCCAGGVLALGSLVVHREAARASLPQLTDAWSGRVAVLLLCLALAPNAAVWAGSYALGPGFALGTGSAVGPLTAGSPAGLPDFPLLAALPSEPVLLSGAAEAHLVLVALLAVPLTAGLVTAWWVAAAAVPEPGRGAEDSTADNRSVTVLTALVAALGCGLLMAALAAFAGGPLGTGALARFGPSAWLTGAAAFGWTAVLAVPASLVWRAQRLHGAWTRAVLGAVGSVVTVVVRRLWLVFGGPLRAAARLLRRLVRPAAAGLRARRRRRRETPAAPEGWRTAAARRMRLRSLKEASGGLMPDFEPCRLRQPDRWC